MAQEPDQLTEDIERRRREISRTVDQIEDRVSPSRALARRRDGLRRRFTDLRDQIVGNDDDEYPVYGRDRLNDPYDPYRFPPGAAATDDDESLGDRARQAGGRARDALDQAPDPRDAARRRTQGSPVAAGVLSFGVGLLIGGVLPSSRTEQRAVGRVQPELESAAQEVAGAGQDVAGTLKEDAQGRAEDLKDQASGSAKSVKDDATSAGQQVKDSAT